MVCTQKEGINQHFYLIDTGIYYGYLPTGCYLKTLSTTGPDGHMRKLFRKIVQKKRVIDIVLGKGLHNLLQYDIL